MTEKGKEAAEARRLQSTRMPPSIIVPWGEDIDGELLVLLSICLWCLRYGRKYASRRSLVDVVADAFRDYQGQLLNPDKTPFIYGDLDRELGGPHYDWVRQAFTVGLGDDWKPNRETRRRLRLVLAALKCGGPSLWRNLKQPYEF